MSFENDVVLGSQEPSFWHAPEYAQTDIEEIVDFCLAIGIDLDLAQEFVLANSMGTRPDGMWAAKRVGLCAPRQNGKSVLLEVRALYGAFVLREPLTIHSAQLFSTAKEQFLRACERIENTPLLAKQVKAVTRTNSQEAIVLHSGSRILYRSRSGMSGRGLSADCIILDEAMFLTEEIMSALEYTLSARPNAQLWYAGSAINQQDPQMDGEPFARLRQRGHAREPRVAWFFWGLDYENPDHVPLEVAGDPANWAAANPAFGSRILHETVEDEFAGRSVRSFAVERLGVGDWPAVEAGMTTLIPLDAWDECEDVESQPMDPVCMAFDVNPERSRGVVAVAGRRSDGKLHVEVIEYWRDGTAGLVPYLIERWDRHQPFRVVCDGASPAASLVPDLVKAGVKVVALTAPEMARGCGALYDGVVQGEVRHRGGDLLRDAIRGAVKRPLVDAWAWSRRNSNVDISPLVAITLALWGVTAMKPVLPPDKMFPSY